MFSVILPGRPCLTNLVTVSPTQFGFSFPFTPVFSHIVVFMLPGNALPPDSAAAVYLQLPGQSDFKLLGAIGNEKQSAIFRIRLPAQDGQLTSGGNIMNDANLMADASSTNATVNFGISVEPAANIQAQLSSLQTEDSTSTALVRRPPPTRVLAQRIIKNAFNFLASFAGGASGQEMVPLKAFQDWWTKFERRVQVDPAFLEFDDA